MEVKGCPFVSSKSEGSKEGSGSVGIARVAHLTRHLTNAQVVGADKDGPEKQGAAPNWMSFASDLTEMDREKSDAAKKQFLGMLNRLPNALNDLDYNIADHLPGPLADKETYPNGWVDSFLDFRKWQIKGESHIGIAELQKRYGGSAGLSANIVMPHLKFGRDGPHDSGQRSVPVVSQEVIIADPEDARRIARIHVKKNSNFTPLFFNSIISTTDQEEWKQQREHLVGCFLPRGSLEKIFPVTLQRAKDCAKRLEMLRLDPNVDGEGFVNMNDFLLYETEAQLQLALFGLDKRFMETTNEKFRASMAGKIDAMYARQFCDELMIKIHEDPTITGPVSSGVNPSCPVKGPLSDGLKSLKMEGYGTKGNAFIFAFAGHDTTGHTLSWLLFELARHPNLQKRLQDEVDQFFVSLGGRDMTYRDLTQLPFMTRCIMETLRLWPAVANGTFREIQFDDTIKGKDGENVQIKKGTLVRIVNWSRHRNPDLWGPDVNEFNPDREFRDSELWNGDVLRAYNPQTERFSPFTFTPRDCIGKNFAHMEMRAILCYLLQSYSFELTDVTKNYDMSKFLGVNYGTMGPQDLHQPEMIQALPGWGPAIRRPMGLRMKPIPRT